MKFSLNELFSLNSIHEDQSIFEEQANSTLRSYKQEEIDFLTAYFSRGFESSFITGYARILFDLSFNAFDILLHAWLSELPIKREILSYGKKIIAVVKVIDNPQEKCRIAENMAKNRLDPDTLTVLNASYKVSHEVHRMMGLLRFTPNEKNEFIAKCEPDHFILPCLGENFSLRFGETPWSIIDEKRGLILRRCRGEKAKIHISSHISSIDKKPANIDEWEELWVHYHKTINNEDRSNPNLQRQFMPKRYWKYLPEVYLKFN